MILENAFIYLFFAVLAVPIAKRLGLGSVLGYLIAGILIGPVLGLVGAETESIKHFAEFGVVIMLFLVGLELQPVMLWRMRHRLLGLGGLQVLVSGVLLTGGGVFLGLNWPSAAAVGMTLALSSTAIVLQTYNEKGWMKTKAGQAGFSVLLFQDIAVIPMLALLPLLGTVVGDGAVQADAHQVGGIGHLPGWLQTLIVFAVIALIIVAGRFLIRPIFRFIAESKLREIFTAAALLLVISIALVMTWVGLSPALGTFIAGVVLSGSEYRHELESDIEPFKGLLLGLFFISVGAGIDFNMILGKPGVIFGLAAAILAVKFLVLIGLTMTFKLRKNDAWLFALSLPQAGEFAFVLFGFAKSNGVLAGDLVSELTLVVAITMLLTPFLFLLYERVIAPILSGELDEAHDAIAEQSPIIVAGIGRFGQIITRLLLNNGYKLTILDLDPEMIELVGNYGMKTYYGDASRPDLLHAAGIDQAKLLIINLNNPEKVNALVEHVTTHHPHVKVLARARSRQHWRELKELGAHVVERELFEGSLAVGREALKLLGHHPFRAEKLIGMFRKYDYESLDFTMQYSPKDGTDLQYRELIKAREREFKELILNDRSHRINTEGRGWTPPPKSDARIGVDE